MVGGKPQGHHDATISAPRAPAHARHTAPPGGWAAAWELMASAEGISVATGDGNPDLHPWQDQAARGAAPDQRRRPMPRMAGTRIRPLYVFWRDDTRWVTTAWHCSDSLRLQKHLRRPCRGQQACPLLVTLNEPGKNPEKMTINAHAKLASSRVPLLELRDKHY
jgi:hypothetical protein